MLKIGYAKAPGTCGELVQGKINGTNFHITCPINLYSEVKTQIIKQPLIEITPAGKTKTKEAIRKILDFFGLNKFGVVAEVKSEIPSGKGMASSTADIMAACLSVANAAGRKVSSKILADIAISIEPSDGIFFPGITLFDHLEGIELEHLGNSIQMDVVVIDDGSFVDTIKFNQNSRHYGQKQQLELKKAISLVKQGVEENNPYLIGKGAIISAQINQEFLPKQRLNEFIELSKKLKCAGINVAHSGNIYGFLCLNGEGKKVKEYLEKYLGNGYKVYLTKLVSGGF